MAKDMIGSITQACVGVPNEFHGVLLDVVNHFNSSCTDNVAWHTRFKEVLQEGLGTVAVAVKGLFKPIMEVTLHSSAEKATKKCFTNTSQYYHRDGDLDNWFPKNQPAQDEKKFSVRELTESATFLEMVGNILGTAGDVVTFSRLLIEAGHTMTLPEIEDLIERQEKGEDVGLRTNGYDNFFFVENTDKTVSVVFVYRGGEQWYVYVSRLDRAYRWVAGYRLFLRNS